jgi:predicted nucleic acid-binding Zn ribbon protein
MPTYSMRCKDCHCKFEFWQSIHEELPRRHNVPFAFQETRCQGKLEQIITRVATYGVGDRGADTRQADERERQLDLDRPAYRRLRREGHQPVNLKGSHRLEALAKNEWEIRTGGLVSVPEDRNTEINEMMADAATGEWDPIQEVHDRRKKAGVE